MPILILALMALGAFLVMGLLLFTALFFENRARNQAAEAAAEDKPKARAARAS